MSRRPKKDSADAAPQSFLVRFEPRSKSQQLFLEAAAKNDIVLALGPAGCGKTMAAVGAACQEIQSAGGRKHLLVLRPAVETGKTLGYLPGSVSEKIEPFMGSFTQALSKVVLGFPPGFCKFEALGFQRGMSYEDCVVILDEAQNANYAQLKMLLTRFGRGCRMYVLGDPDQADIKPTVPDYDVDLDAVVDALAGLPRVAVVEYPATDSLRHPLVAKILRRLNNS